MKKEVNSKYLINRDKWTEALASSKLNPAIMLHYGLNYLEEVTEGELDFVDVSNPTTLLMEMGATIGANNYGYFLSADKKHYPILSTEMNDLYHHMTDDMYQNRLAHPASATFQMIFKIDQIKEYAAQTNVSGLRKIIIPRRTLFQVDGINFTFLTAVEIRIGTNDSIQVVYSKDYTDPIEKIESNILEYYFIRNDKDEPCLVIEVPLKQITIVRKRSALTHLGSVFNEQYTYPTQLMLVRNHLVKTNDVVVPVKTTYSESVYDASDVTVRVRPIGNNQLSLNIPLIYYNQKLVHDMNVVTDIYCTEGEVNHPLRQMTESYKVAITFEDMEISEADSIYTAALPNFDIWVKAITDCIGGTDEMSYTEMKKWVTLGAKDKLTPITNLDIKDVAAQHGYDIVTDIDNLTHRIFHATRKIYGKSTKFAEREISCSIDTFLFSVDGIKTNEHVRYHEDTSRLTILPSAVFKTNNSKIELLFERQLPVKVKGNYDQYIDEINKLEFITTPFHYVVDVGNKGKQTRAFYMDDPQLLGQNFVDNNHSTPLLVAADKVTVKKEIDGYLIEVVTRSSDDYKALEKNTLFAQMAFIPEGQTEWAYINGSWEGTIDDNDIWFFRLTTRFDFDEFDNLIVNNFKMINTENRNLSTSLKRDFTLLFGIYDYNGDQDATIPLNQRAFIPILNRNRTSTVISENSLKIKLGHALNDLWKNTRVVNDLNEYEVYDHNVPLVYNESIYELDERGVPISTPSDNGPVFTYRHRAGDPVLDSNGQPHYKYRKGDVKLGEDGNPIIRSSGKTLRAIDMLFLDGIYHFATNDIDVDYINSIPKLIVNWIEQDLIHLKKRMLENTQIYFSPKRTMGYVNIVVENNESRTIFNRLPFTVKYYLTNDAFKNAELKETIRAITIVVIADMLQRKTISRDIIEYELRKKIGEQYLYGVNVVDMGLGSDINTFTLQSDSEQCSIRRKLALQSNGQLKVVEDITIQFINHDKEV